MRDLLLISDFRASLNKSAESWIVRINGKAMLERWMEKIGSRNIKHLTRYLVWKKEGVCPPKTTVIERMLILKDWDISSTVKA